LALPLILCMEVSVTLPKNLKGISAPALRTFAVKAKKATGLRKDVGVRLISNSEMRRMNAWFCGKDKPTDVLSFPAETIPDYAGDIAISADYARDNARRLGHSINDEIKVLILHGMLHLAGFDHETDKGEMALRERALRKKLQLPSTLTERAAVKPRSPSSIR